MMNRRLIASLRLLAWVPVLACFLLGCDWNAKPSVDRVDVETVQTIRANYEAGGDFCWSAGSDMRPDLVIFSRGGEVTISAVRRDINHAIEQGVFGIDHGLDPSFVFCEVGD